MTDEKRPPQPGTKDERQTDAARTGDKANPDNAQGEMNERLDEALEETFPSSDPISVKITK